MTANELVYNHMGLIKKIANKFYNYAREDLIQVGVIGLLKAYQNFKEGDAKFSTYAYPYIFGEMYNLVHANRDIKVSKDLLKLYKVIDTLYICNEFKIMLLYLCNYIKVLLNR